MTENSGDQERGSAGVPAARPDQVMDALCEAYARDELEMEELERRLDVAARAPTSQDLLDLVSDLDPRHLPVALGGRGGVKRAGGAPRPGPGSEGDDDPGSALQVPPGVGRVDPARVPNRQLEVAFFSGRTRKGSWTPARQITATACMGGVELDFREALFGADEVEIYAVAIMGGIEILVPPGVHVDTSGFAFLGGFEEDSALEANPDPEAPTIRIRGFACMGAVEVNVRYPGESSKDAKRRLKEERRRLRESRRRALESGNGT